MVKLKNYLLSILLTMAFFLSLSANHTNVYAEKANGNNLYNNRKYETRSDVEQLEKLLVQDGYEYINCDTEIGKELALDRAYWFCTILTEYSKDMYHVYIRPEDYGEYKATNDAYVLNNNTVVCDYYVFDYVDANPEGLMDNDIPFGEQVGYIHVTAKVDEDFSDTITVNFYEEQRSETYGITLEKANNYERTVKVIVGKYYLESFYNPKNNDPKYDYSYSQDGKNLVENGTWEVEMDFTSGYSSDETAYNPPKIEGSEIQADDVYSTQKPALDVFGQQDTSNDGFNFGLLIFGLAVVLLAVVLVLVIKNVLVNKMRDNEEE